MASPSSSAAPPPSRPTSTPSSSLSSSHPLALYHQWLTPDQFAARFGVADSDIAAVENWLQLQGFSIDSVARSRNRINFSGTAALVASAFGAPLHYFKSTNPDGTSVTHFAPSTDLTSPPPSPPASSPSPTSHDFRPHSHLKHAPASTRPPSLESSPTSPPASPATTSSPPATSHTIYDITPAYNAGFTGSNQSIAVLGQSAVMLSDIAAFQSATGILAKTPQLVLVPGSGTSTAYSGDEGESDLDLEYTSTIAKGAQVFFVYTRQQQHQRRL